MKPFVLGLAGGTGSGKSTVAFGLQDKFPGQVTIVHLDDYFRPTEQVPVFEGVPNWDDPEALRHAQMVEDLKALKQGKTVSIMTKSPRLNPAYEKTDKRIPVDHPSRPLIVVEGFLTLWYPDLRKELDVGIYLKAPYELHVQRRVHFINPHYREKVLKPMHDKYVEPSIEHADKVLDVSKLSKEQTLAEVLSYLPDHFVSGATQ